MGRGLRNPVAPDGRVKNAARPTAPAENTTTSAGAFSATATTRGAGADEITRRLTEGLAVQSRHTYERRKQLKSLGCMWSAAEKLWLAPDAATLHQAMTICEPQEAQSHPATHAHAHAQAQAQAQAQRPAEREWARDSKEETWRLSGSHSIGEVIPGSRDTDRRYLVLAIESSQYLSRDAIEDMYGSWGAETMDAGRYTNYRVREVALSEEESARLQAREAARSVAARREELISEIATRGEYGSANEQPLGEIIASTQTIYGGGDWFVVGDGSTQQPWIWAVSNNGADGDNWSRNNIETQGAGAIGRRVPWSAELAAEIRQIAEQPVSGSMEGNFT